jgi:hypothetical protein
MDRSPSEPDSVRETVIRIFRDYGASDADIAGMRDTHLIRDGHYCGRSFRTPSLMAMWMGGFVQFYDAEGELLGSVDLTQKSRRQRAA